MNPLLYALLAEQAYSVVPDIGMANSASRAIVRDVVDGRCAVFRGSDNIASWLKDLDAIEQHVDGLGFVHAGFYSSLVENLPMLLKADPDVVCGHSLGAALAILLAAQMCLCGHPPKAVFAFEPPRVSADGTIARLFTDHGVQAFLYRNGNDLVTQVPMLPETWQHPATLIQIGTPTLPIDNIEDHLMGNVIDALKISYLPTK